MSKSEDILILVNFFEHLHIIFKNVEINHINDLFYIKKKLMRNLEKLLTFDYSNEFGFINSDINLIGSGNCISAIIKIFNDDHEKIKEVINLMNFDEIIFTDKIKLREFSKLSKSEDFFINNFLNKISALLYLDNDNLLSNLHLEIADIESSSVTKKEIIHAYKEHAEKFMNIFTSTGFNLNTFINNFIYNPKSEYSFVFNNNNQYLLFKDFIFSYLKYKQNFNLWENVHISKGEEINDFPEIENIENLQYLRFTAIRNLKDFSYICDKYCERDEINKHITKIIHDKFNKEIFWIKKNNNNKFIAESSEHKFNEEETKSMLNKLGVKIWTDEFLYKFYDLGEFSDFTFGLILFSNDIYGIISDIDHIKFVCYINKDKDLIIEKFRELMNIINDVSKHLRFDYDKNIGFLTSSPFYIGTGLICEAEITTENKDFMKEMNSQNNFEIELKENLENEDGLITLFVKNIQTIGVTETEILNNFILLLNKTQNES